MHHAPLDVIAASSKTLADTMGAMARDGVLQRVGHGRYLAP
jgi:hypothetical protein